MMVYPKKIQQERLVERTAPWENESHHRHQSAAISGDSQALNWCYLNRNNDTSLKKLMFPGKRAILIRTKKVIETVPLLQCNLFTAFIGCPGVDELLESVRSLWQSDMENGNDSILWIGGIPTPLKNMKVSWGDYSQYMEKPIGNPIYIYIFNFVDWESPWETHSFNFSESHLHLWIMDSMAKQHTRG